VDSPSSALRVRHWARIVLALIRLINGGAALAAPNVLGSRLGVDTETSPGFGYAFRLFGVRTVLLGVQLLLAPDGRSSAAVREAPLVHGADTAAAVVVMRRQELPPRGAKVAIVVSALNLVLALLANLEPRTSE
jgi:hypothetical protein